MVQDSILLEITFKEKNRFIKIKSIITKFISETVYVDYSFDLIFQ